MIIIIVITIITTIKLLLKLAQSHCDRDPGASTRACARTRMPARARTCGCRRRQCVCLSLLLSTIECVCDADLV